jgi:YggT family protein
MQWVFFRGCTVFREIFTFIVDSIALLFAGFLLMRFWVQALRVRPPAQLAQAIYQITDWIVQPLRRILPGIGGYDWASIVATLMVGFLVSVLDIWLFQPVSIINLIVIAGFNVIEWAVYGLIGCLVLEVILSWVNPYAPMAPFFRSLNEPILAPLRRAIPQIGGIDFSPLVALLAFQILLRVLREMLPYLLRF